MHSLKSLEGKTILVTGATGFIGTHLVRRLQENLGINLVLLSRKRMGESLEGVTWVTTALDQLTPETWQTANVEQIDVVFHLGAFTPKSIDVSDCVEAVYQDNILGTRCLLESFPASPERIVFSSTLDLYAPLPDGAILNESSPVEPASLYGASKLFCEQLIRTYARQHGYGYAILRYGHIFGPGEEAYKKLIPQTIRQLMRNESPVLYGDGSAKRDFLYVEDAVEATLRSATSDVQRIEPVNIVRGESTTIRHIVETLIQITEFTGSIQYLADKPVGYSRQFDNSKLGEILGKWNLVPLEDGLRREVEYFRSLGK